MSQVCVDAGIDIKVIAPEADRALAEALFARWTTSNIEIIAPAFAAVEIDSVIRQKMLRGELTQAVADTTFQ